MMTGRGLPGRRASTRASTLVPRRVPAAKRVSAWLWTGRTNPRIGWDDRRLSTDEAPPNPADTPAEIAAELGLAGPLTPEQLASRWRNFVWRNHPDRQPATNVIAQARALLSPTPFMIERGANGPTRSFRRSRRDATFWVRRSPGVSSRWSRSRGPWLRAAFAPLRRNLARPCADCDCQLYSALPAIKSSGASLSSSSRTFARACCRRLGLLFPGRSRRPVTSCPGRLETRTAGSYHRSWRPWQAPKRAWVGNQLLGDSKPLSHGCPSRQSIVMHKIG